MFAVLFVCSREDGPASPPPVPSHSERRPHPSPTGRWNGWERGSWSVSLGENCALAANHSVDCHATILFTISLNSAIGLY